jgi:hypothetical protein
MSTRNRLFPAACAAFAVLLLSPFSLAAQGVAAPNAPPPLFDSGGRPLPSPPAMVPADTAARTRQGLYATRAQFEWEELMSTPTTVLLDVDDLGSVGGALLQAQQVRALQRHVAFAYFVRARHAADAAAAANALADEGFAPVFTIVH